MALPQSKPPNVSDETLRALCAAAGEFRALAPWEFLSDNNLLGIQEPDGTLRLVSVLGNAGIMYGLTIHRGEQGLRWALLTATTDADPRQDPNFTYSQDGLLLEFAPRAELEKHDLALLKRIGFKPFARGPQGWPKFRSQQPGAAPWYVEQVEAELLLADLRKAIHFCRMVAARKNLFQNRAPDEVALYPKEAPLDRPLLADDIDWQTLVLADEPLPKPLSLSDSERASLAALRRQGDISIEIDCLYSPELVADGSRPYFPWLSMAVDARDGIILGIELANARTEQPADVAGRCVVKVLNKLQCRPSELIVKRPELAVALAPVAEALDTAIFQVSSLPFLEMAYADLRRSMESPGPM